MSSDWRRLSRDAHLPVSGDGLLIKFPDGRKQQVYVEDGPAESLRVWSIAGMPSRVVSSTGEDCVHLAAWTRNRASDLVGFKLDGRRRLIGEAWVPLAGLEPDEWRVYVMAVAQACDRTEYLLGGGDEN